jgi:hypothetical protein
MATEADLFLAILALDAYNRGYGPGMTFSNDSDSAGTEIGDATILAATDDQKSQGASFYAVAYDWEGETVISYRGTRFPGLPDSGDFFKGWFLSAGYASVAQPQMALDFYARVHNDFAHGQDIQLTGHSLGGGLAGFVSDITGAPADVFNNIPFGTGVVAEILSHDLSQGMTLSAFVFLGYDPITGQRYESLPTSSAQVRQFIT